MTKRLMGQAESPPQDMVDDPYVTIRRSEYERLLRIADLRLSTDRKTIPLMTHADVASRCPDTGELFCTCSAHGGT